MKRVILLFLFLTMVCTTFAQELTVKSFEAKPMDLSASTNPRLDKNDVACALVKVQLAAVGAQFVGNVLGDSEYKAGEYWVYMSQGSYQLVIRHPNFVPLTVNFRDYDIRGVESKTTYVLTLLMPQMGQAVDDGIRYLAMTVEPKEATVMIDDKLQTPNNGQVKIRLSKGVHQYTVMASGYATKSGSVTLDEGTARLDVKLESVKATLTVNCATSDAEVYINGEHKGKAPLKEILPANNYEIEVRLAGYRSNKQSISLSESENRTVDVPALQALTGNLDVNYDPIDAEVWLDGKQLGTSPAIFRNVLVGRHEVELRASGYTTKKETGEVKEGQTVSLAGQLQQSAGLTATTGGSGAVETFTVGGVQFRMVRVAGGTFQMGSNDSDADSDEKPVHQVTLSDYYIGETEVTQALWQAVTGSTVRQQRDKADKSWSMRGEGPNYPMYYVSWVECQKFVEKLNAQTGRTFRLPTEAEWEYAARGGNKPKGYKYSGSDDIGSVAWYDGNSGNTTHEVKKKQANELGLYDMSGNVWEWCQDRKGEYSNSAQTNPIGPSSGSNRVYRGGSWYFNARCCRSSYRDSSSPSHRFNNLGFRLAL